ncbi:MAG: acyl carrier protein [Bacteroidales bacterium]|nr:acyl carrier protein [Candidatus Colicola equi]
MCNIDKYNNIYIQVFGATIEQLNEHFSKQNVPDWDSVHQLNIVSLMEDEFNIMLDPEDIMACTSYIAGKNILSKYGIEC